MAYNQKYKQTNVRAKTIKCFCGGEAKFVSRKNYPFGKKSGAIISQFYKCKSCNKTTYLDKTAGGKNESRRK